MRRSRGLATADAGWVDDQPRRLAAAESHVARQPRTAHPSASQGQRDLVRGHLWISGQSSGRQDTFIASGPMKDSAFAILRTERNSIAIRLTLD